MKHYYIIFLNKNYVKMEFLFLFNHTQLQQ